MVGLGISMNGRLRMSLFRHLGQSVPGKFNPNKMMLPRNQVLPLQSLKSLFSSKVQVQVIYPP